MNAKYDRATLFGSERVTPPWLAELSVGWRGRAAEVPPVTSATVMPIFRRVTFNILLSSLCAHEQHGHHNCNALPKLRARCHLVKSSTFLPFSLRGGVPINCSGAKASGMLPPPPRVIAPRNFFFFREILKANAALVTYTYI